MNGITTLVKVMFGLRIVAVILVIAAAIYLGPTIFQGASDLFYGITDRIDYATGYPGADR